MAPEYTEIDRMGNSRSPRYGSPVTNWLIHTQEGNGTAESLAAYLNNSANGVSYHYTIDNNRTVVDVVDTDYASWSVLSANSFTINACFAGSRASWSRTQWLDLMGNGIEIAAWLAVQDARKYGFSTAVNPPPYWRGPGISDHNYVTQELGIGNHTDVGPNFPWDVFTDHVNRYASGEEGDDMPSAEDIARAVWAAKVTKPDGTGEQAGILLGWIDQHTGDALDQAAGPGTKNQRTGTKGPLKPTGWPQLAKPGSPPPERPSLVDGVATKKDVLDLQKQVASLTELVRSLVPEEETGGDSA